MAHRLVARGFSIIARNVRLRRGELDLVAARDGVWWFVECKCRSRRDVGTPLRAVDARKRAALFAAAREFVARRDFRGDWGFLAASVVWEASERLPVIGIERLAIGPAAFDRRG